jgi:hypothetical protein
MTELLPMASRSSYTPEDIVAIVQCRAHLGDAAASQLAAEIYKLRLAQTPQPNGFYGFPRWTIALIALWLALLETADKLPKLLLTYPAYRATLAELNAKEFQLPIAAAQAFKLEQEAKAAGAGLGLSGTSERLSLMFDLLDPLHPNGIADGMFTPDINALRDQILRNNPHAFDSAPSGAKP